MNGNELIDNILVKKTENDVEMREFLTKLITHEKETSHFKNYYKDEIDKYSGRQER